MEEFLKEKLRDLDALENLITLGKSTESTKNNPALALTPLIDTLIQPLYFIRGSYRGDMSEWNKSREGLLLEALLKYKKGGY